MEELPRRTKRRKKSSQLSPRNKLWYLGIGLTGLGIAIFAHIGWFYVRGTIVGRHLVKQERNKIAHGGTPHSSGASLAGFFNNQNAQGLLEIPALHLTAPVVQGDGNHQLNTAVGHLATSVWPGTTGTSVLAAHDVTWFHHIPQLKNNAVIKYVTPHITWIFHVVGHKVVKTGSPLRNSLRSSMVLETCYPVSALYLTPYRYLVRANLVRKIPTVSRTRSGITHNQSLKAEIPSALLQQGLTLATNYAPMGHLKETGNPTAQWIDSNAPLRSASQATTLFFAALHTAALKNTGWWKQIAPGVALSAIKPLWGTSVHSYSSSIDEALQVRENKVTSMELSTVFTIAGGLSPGVYRVAIRYSVHNNHVFIAKWSMVP